MFIPEQHIRPAGPWQGTRAGWIDAYCTAMSAMRPTLKPAEVSAMAQAAVAKQVEFQPDEIAYLEAELGPLNRGLAAG